MSNHTPPPGPKSEFRRSAVRILQLVIIAYVLFVLAAAIFQRRLIYFPRTIPPALAESAAAELGFVPWRNPSGQIIGWKLPAASSPIASVLITHGNAGCAIDRGYLADPIHDAAPVDVYVLEYPGYGSRGGSPDKQSIPAAAEEAFGLLTNGQPKYLVSESIGAGVACYLARTHPTEVAGLVLFMPYHNLASVAQRKDAFASGIFPFARPLQSRQMPQGFSRAGKNCSRRRR